MGKYSPPKTSQTFEVAEKEETVEAPVVEATESKNFPLKDAPTAELLSNKIDNFIDLLAGHRNVPSDKYGEEQLLFMAALDDTIKQEYSVFTTVMDKMVNRVRVETAAFRMERLFVYTQHKDVKKAKTDAYIQKHITLMSAVVTLGRNLRDRQRVGRQVDIVTLTKGYHPKAALNLQNYFTRTYS
ncbi:hypothetical protein [Vibrio phage phiKT1028]|nr:hypothetical protein [Vibrio phage phiKT1028]